MMYELINYVNWHNVLNTKWSLEKMIVFQQKWTFGIFRRYNYCINIYYKRYGISIVILNESLVSITIYQLRKNVLFCANDAVFHFLIICKYGTLSFLNKEQPIPSSGVTNNYLFYLEKPYSTAWSYSTILHWCWCSCGAFMYLKFQPFKKHNYFFSSARLPNSLMISRDK